MFEIDNHEFDEFWGWGLESEERVITTWSAGGWARALSCWTSNARGCGHIFSLVSESGGEYYNPSQAGGSGVSSAHFPAFVDAQTLF